MEPVRIGQILFCDQCGVELKVVKDCDATCPCNIICCEKPLRLKEQREGEGTASESCCG
jgi:hypothetical protein